MTIEQQRKTYAEIRSRIPSEHRGEWREIEQAFKDLDVPPSPSEWIAEVRKFANEVNEYHFALQAWVNLRSENEAGWGEEHDPNAEIKGWRDELDYPTKTCLLRRQLNEDINTMTGHDEWLESRD